MRVIVVLNDGLLYWLYTGLYTRWCCSRLLRFVCHQIFCTENKNRILINNKNTKNRLFAYFLLSVMVVIVFSGSCVDVILPTDVISVTSVVLAMSLRTIGTDNRERFNNGSDSQLLPSNQFRASGPNFRINA